MDSNMILGILGNFGLLRNIGPVTLYVMQKYVQKDENHTNLFLLTITFLICELQIKTLELNLPNIQI